MILEKINISSVNDRVKNDILDWYCIIVLGGLICGFTFPNKGIRITFYGKRYRIPSALTLNDLFMNIKNNIWS